jgi:hypothetical protein
MRRNHQRSAPRDLYQPRELMAWRRGQRAAVLALARRAVLDAPSGPSDADAALAVGAAAAALGPRAFGNLAGWSEVEREGRSARACELVWSMAEVLRTAEVAFAGEVEGEDDDDRGGEEGNGGNGQQQQQQQQPQPLSGAAAVARQTRHRLLRRSAHLLARRRDARERMGLELALALWADGGEAAATLGGGGGGAPSAAAAFAANPLLAPNEGAAQAQQILEQADNDLRAQARRAAPSRWRALRASVGAALAHARWSRAVAAATTGAAEGAGQGHDDDGAAPESATTASTVALIRGAFAVPLRLRGTGEGGRSAAAAAEAAAQRALTAAAERRRAQRQQARERRQQERALRWAQHAAWDREMSAGTMRAATPSASLATATTTGTAGGGTAGAARRATTRAAAAAAAAAAAEAAARAAAAAHEEDEWARAMALRPVRDAARLAEDALGRALEMAEARAAAGAGSAAGPTAATPPPAVVVTIPVESTGVASAVAMRAQMLLAEGRGHEAVRVAERAALLAAPQDADARRLVAALLREARGGGGGGGGGYGAEDDADEDEDDEEDDEDGEDDGNSGSGSDDREQGSKELQQQDGEGGDDGGGGHSGQRRRRRRRHRRVLHRLRDAAAATLDLDPWCAGAAQELRLASAHCPGCCAARARAALRRCDLRAGWELRGGGGAERGEADDTDDEEDSAELGWGSALDALVQAAHWALCPVVPAAAAAAAAAASAPPPPPPEPLRRLFAAELSPRRRWWPSSALPARPAHAAARAAARARADGSATGAASARLWRLLGEQAGVAALCAGSGNGFTAACAREMGLLVQAEEGEEGGFDTSAVPAAAREGSTALMRGVRMARDLERRGLVV